MNIRRHLQDRVARILYSVGVSSPLVRCVDRLTIVTFHRVLPDAQRDSYPFPGLVVTPEELERFLEFFVDYFDCGTLAVQTERFLGSASSNKPLLAITFDDGQHDNFCYARPVLARFGVRASFFVPVLAVEKQELLWHDRMGFAAKALMLDGGEKQRKLEAIVASAGVVVQQDSPALLDSLAEGLKGIELSARLRLVDALVGIAEFQMPEFARPMTFGELSELACEGHEIGSHSMSHCLMPECDDRTLAYEVAESRRVLAFHVGQPIESFCYPNGTADRRSAMAVAKAGYRWAVTTAWGLNGRGADHFQLKRCDMVTRHNLDANDKFMPARLAFRLSGLNPKLR